MSGATCPISVVCEIRDRAATILRNAGYIAAVQVPEQRIAEGTVRFQVLMAHLTQVRVRGDATGAESLIAGYLNQLTKQPVFNRYEAERYLLLASDLPGYTVRLTLRPAGTVAGDVIGDVTVQRTPAYADFNVQNAGSKALGRWGGLLRGQVFGLTGLGDRTTVSVFTTSDFKEQQTVQLGHDFHLGPERSQHLRLLHLRVGEADDSRRARARQDAAQHVRGRLSVRPPPGLFGARLGRHGLSSTRTSARTSIDLTRDRLAGRLPQARLRQPAVRFSKCRLFARRAAVAGQRDPRASPGHAHPRRHARLRADRCAIASASATSRRAASKASRTRRCCAIPCTARLRPVPKLTLALGVRAQYAWKPLLSFEEFSAGNYTAGRGYDPGALLGDRGFGSQAEIRYGSRIPTSARKPAIEGYVFWDHALVRNRDRLVVVEGSEHLDSVGGGARVNFDRFALDATLAVPLTRVGLDDKRPDPRFLISLTTRLWPWSYR